MDVIFQETLFGTIKMFKNDGMQQFYEYKIKIIILWRL